MYPGTTERTEDQIIAKDPLKLRFGTRDHDVPILGFRKAKEWRANAVDRVREIVNVHRTECDNNDVFTHGLAFFFLQFPDKMLDLICLYGPALDRNVIEDEGTDEQVARAFGQVVAIAFPFTKELGMISTVMGIAQNFPQLAKSTN